MNSATNLVFVAGKRNPFGAFGGSLKEVNLADLAAPLAEGLLQETQLAPSEVDHVIVGNVLQSSVDSIYVARHIGLKAKIPQEVPALAINRLCGSGFQVLIEAQHQMDAQDTKLALVGGVENMSLTPYVLRNTRWGNKMGHSVIEDYLSAALVDTHCGCPMAITAENLAEQYKISRSEVDAFALLSQARTKAAIEKNIFSAEIQPFHLKDRKGQVQTISSDEHPKPNTTLDILAKLKPVFKKDGVVTAGNSSGIVDGAAMMLVATEQFARQRKLSPLGRLVGYAVAGVDPRIMGIGPVPAIQKALKKASLTLGQIDLIEINEAFAAQYLAVEKELQLDRAITNVNGGAIAIGHPLAASGTRLTLHLLQELKRRKKKLGLAAACIGGGQGIAIIVEAF